MKPYHVMRHRYNHSEPEIVSEHKSINAACRKVGSVISGKLSTRDTCKVYVYDGRNGYCYNRRGQRIETQY